MQRRALGLLFLALAGGLATVGVLSARAGGRAWVIAAAALVLAGWMLDLARRAIRRG